MCNSTLVHCSTPAFFYSGKHAGTDRTGGGDARRAGRDGKKRGIALITIDYKDPRPIYEQIVERYEALIVRGILKPDEQMPSVREMAQELSLNPNTIQKAYSILELKGYIYSVKGRGNYVSPGTDAHDRKRESYREKLTACLREGIALGIRLDEIIETAEHIYGEGNP